MQLMAEHTAVTGLKEVVVPRTASVAMIQLTVVQVASPGHAGTSSHSVLFLQVFY